MIKNIPGDLFPWAKGENIMSGKGRHAIRMSNLLEKSHHIKLESINDPTLINYLALYAAIVDKKPKKDMRYYLVGLFDAQESDERMQQIDRDRSLGVGTELDHELWLEKFKKETEKNKYKYAGRKIKVINPSTGTDEIFPTISAFCEEYELKKENVRSAFNVKKSNKIKYKGLILEKL